MKTKWRRIISVLCTACLMGSLCVTASAKVQYLPDVTEEMNDPGYWSGKQADSKKVLMNLEDIKTFNQDTMDAKGTSVMDLRNATETFNGITKNAAIEQSSTADAKYYYGWTYGGDGSKATWDYYQDMIDNCIDPTATEEQHIKYGIAVNRALLQVFPTENPIWDDPNDPDFNYQALSGIRVNEPIIIYTTSADGKYYLARISCCSGWVAVEDVAICKDKEEWLSAWDIPAEDVLMVYGNKVYTDTSNSHPEISRRMLTFGTALETTTVPTGTLVGNRAAYHNHVVYLPIRNSDGSYSKELALIPQTAKVYDGYLPLTKENIAMVALGNLGDAYGWGGMMNVEDCSSFVRTVYACFGLDIARNGNRQWYMSIPKIDMTGMTVDEKCAILDQLPLGTALCFSGHEMMYLGKDNGKYYVISTVSKMMNPDDKTKTMRVRDVVINALDVYRANGNTWMQDLNKAMMPAYGLVNGNTYPFPTLKWYHNGVDYCLNNKLMDCEADGMFRVDDVTTRAEMVEAMWRTAGKPTVSMDLTFKDVPADAPYADAVRWAVSKGVSVGYGKDAFGPQDPLTREQLVTVLHKYAQVIGVDVSAKERTSISKYIDASQISRFAETSMRWACGSGMISGTSANTLTPKGSCTRAQFAVILEKFCENVLKL